MLTSQWGKASYSNSFSNCLEARWQKSSRSTYNGSCAEAAWRDGMVLVRDSKLGEGSPVLEFTPAAWAAFLAGLPVPVTGIMGD
jgi:hypothetical protein